MNRDSLIRRYAGCQTFLTEGCLFLSLLSIAEEYSKETFDCLRVLEYARKMGYITDNNDLTIIGQTSLLKDLTGKTWERVVMSKLPATVPDAMYTIEKWVNGKKTHFRRRFVDTLSNSITVRDGKLVEYYTYTWR